jgi:hypothetical protein
MQNELDAVATTLPIDILGLNAIGLEAGNAAICSGRDLPWLQPDVTTEDPWLDWGVTWRDVWVLDADNVPIAVYNLTSHNLADPLHYEELKALLLTAAQ